MEAIWAGPGRLRHQISLHRLKKADTLMQMQCRPDAVQTRCSGQLQVPTSLASIRTADTAAGIAPSPAHQGPARSRGNPKAGSCTCACVAHNTSQCGQLELPSLDS
eukprot:185469-Chlamydomonas_euryale.AAC.4